MLPNLDRYNKELDSLIQRGEQLHMGLQQECFPAEFEKAFKKALGNKAKEAVKALRSFAEAYHPWYSEPRC